MSNQKVNSKSVVDLLNVLGDEVGFFVNGFDNLGFTADNDNISVYIERGLYHLALGNDYFNWLTLEEIADKITEYRAK